MELEDIILLNNDTYSKIYGHSILDKTTQKILEIKKFYEEFYQEDFLIFVAGGFMRDLVSFVKPKDMDVYLIPINGGLPKFTTDIKYGNFGQGISIDLDRRKFFNVEVCDTTIPVDILICDGNKIKDVEDLFNTFDTDIIQVAWDGEQIFFSSKTPDIKQYIHKLYTVTSDSFNSKRKDRLESKGWKNVNTLLTDIFEDAW